MKVKPELSDLHLESFKTLILENYGLSFEKDRIQVLRSGLVNRLAHRNIESIIEYHDIIRRDPDEMQSLVELLTVNETYFFRESEYLGLMMKRLIPELKAQRPNDRLKIMSAGCSTGEEPYSIAMLLNDSHGSEGLQSFDVVGVDIDGSVISKAIKGEYGKYSFRGMDSVYLERYFESAGTGTFRVKKNISSQVTFHTANLFSSIYPAVMLHADIIFYRNVSIYFPAHVQEEILGRLADCLNTGGYLIVSATETMHHNIGILSLLEIDGLFVYRKLVGTLSGDRRHHRRKEPEAVRPLTTKNARQPELLKAPEKQGRHLDEERKIKGLFDDALEHAQAGRSDLALSVLDELISQDKGFVNAHALRASLLISVHRLNEAQNACNEALKHDSFCLAACLMLGVIAHQKGQNETGLKHFREAVYLDSVCWPAHFYLAEINHLMGEKKRAIAGYQTTLEILSNGTIPELGTKYFPLIFNAQQFLVVCRHKIGILKKI